MANIGPKAGDNSLKGLDLISSGPAVFERFLFLQQLLPSLLIGVAVYGRTYIYAIGTYHHKVGSSILSVSDEGYSRNVSCALNLISTFLFESRSWRGVLDTTLCEKCLLVT
jgi:hypothetical protein